MKVDIEEPTPKKTYKKPKSVEEFQKNYSPEDISMSDYADKLGCRYDIVRKTVAAHREELGDDCYKLGTTTMLKPGAIKILDEYIKGKVIEKVSEKPVKVDNDKQYFLKVRIKLAWMINKEDNPKLKREYYRLLKDLNDEAEDESLTIECAYIDNPPREMIDEVSKGPRYANYNK